MGYSGTNDAKGNPITLEAVEELYGFLKGREVEGITCQHMPHLSEDEAYSVIYFLQEKLEVLPDNVEQCVDCKTLIDAHSEGYYRDEVGHYCDSCSVGVSPN